MSLATLKKKTSAKYNNVSTNTGVFSLNGTLRIQGYVGQSFFGRSMDPCICTNDSNVVKKSSMNTRGQLRTQYKYLWRPAPHTSVKPDSAQNTNTSGDYTNFKKRNTIQAEKTCTPVSNPASSCNNDLFIKDKKETCTITQDESTFTSIPQSKFINILKGKCIDNDVFFVPSTTSNTPFGSSI